MSGMLHQGRQVMSLILLFFAVLYIVLSIRDFRRDLRFVFAPRLLRRINRKHVAWATALTFLFTALCWVNSAPPADWLTGLVLFVSAIAAIQIIRVGVGEIRSAYQPRMMRGLSCKRFSLRLLLELTVMAALFFAILQLTGWAALDWLSAALVVSVIYGGYHLIRLAIVDLTFEGTRRHTPAARPKTDRPTEAPNIEV